MDQSMSSKEIDRFFKEQYGEVGTPFFQDRFKAIDEWNKEISNDDDRHFKIK
jgi:hypothetical protein